MPHIVIIGNGISGVTCSRHVRKHSADTITIIGAETEHFYARTALMYIYMGHMKYEHTKPYEDFFWKKNNINLIHSYVSRLDTDQKEIMLSNEKNISYDKLIIATGSKSNIPDLKGKDLQGVQGLYSYPDLQKMEANTKTTANAVVAGGGLIGIEMAEMLVSKNIQVTMLIRESAYWGNTLAKAESDLIARHIREHRIELLFNTEIAEILEDEYSCVKAIRTNKGDLINCEFVGLTMGVLPNIDLVKGTRIETDKGILVNEYFETNVDGVCAIGDCAQFRVALPGRKEIEQLWYTGRMQGETLAKTILGSRTAYQPGPWFNSAKFLDIEYQTYGETSSKVKDEDTDFYWEHPDGRKALRICYEKKSEIIKGVNAFGIRLRHQVIENWLLNKKPIEYMLMHLADVNFDPEFSQRHEKDIIGQFNQQNGRQLMPLKRSWKRLLTILNA